MPPVLSNRLAIHSSVSLISRIVFQFLLQSLAHSSPAKSNYLVTFYKLLYCIFSNSYELTFGKALESNYFFVFPFYISYSVMIDISILIRISENTFRDIKYFQSSSHENKRLYEYISADTDKLTR